MRTRNEEPLDRDIDILAGKLDLTFPYQLTVPLLKDVKSQSPEAVCELRTPNSAGTLIVNRTAPPFDNPDLRRALALSLDRKGFIDILSEGQGKIGAALLPPPEGVWGMPAEMLRELPGYDPDVQKNRAQARHIMEQLGWGPDRRLKLKVVARNVPLLRDPAVILIGQLKEIYIDASSRTRASYPEPPTTPTFKPKLRSVPRKSASTSSSLR